MGRYGKSSNDATLALHQLPGQLLTEKDLECEQWYQAFPEWPEPSSTPQRATNSQWLEVAQNALASSSRMYEKRVNNASTDAITRALNKEKTVSDKIAAVTLLVQESPIHRLDELRTLLSFAQKKGRRERAPAMDAIKDLLINDLLPNQRRLIFFQDRNFSCPKSMLSKRHVLYALYESELKSLYREFLEILEETGGDTLAFFKEKTVKTIYQLLVAKPENEKSLLAMLVNKVGDPDRKVSSTASYSLLRLIEADHPQMRLIVVKEIERLLTRPHVTRRTQYYSICFLNQIRFTDQDVELARMLIRIYMDLFTVCLEEEKTVEREPKDIKIRKRLKRRRKRKKANGEEVKKPQSGADAKETRLMGALLVGVNRAFPYTKPEEDESSYQDYHNALFQVAHAKTLSSSTHAMAFLFQVSQRNATQSDRFYRALYSRIYDAANSSEMTQAAFLNLVYKAMKADTNKKRVKAFMKRVFQAGCHGTPGFAGACVMVISEAFARGERGLLKSFISLTEKDDGDEEFGDIDSPSSSASNDSDITELSIENGIGGTADQKTGDARAALVASGTLNDLPDTSTPILRHKGYDPNKRDPQHAGAEESSLWEAVTLTAHYHPSVSLFARTICTDMKPVSSTTDPLKDFSQIAFLDRFSYKKAKNRVAKSLYGKRSAQYRKDPLANSEGFQELVKAGNVAQDDMFFARFFSANPQRVRREIGPNTGTKIQEEGHGSDLDSEEEAFQVAMEAEMRRLGGGGFLSNGVPDFAGDVDGQDEDEMKAFEKAFENEIVGSAHENDNGEFNKTSSIMPNIEDSVDSEDSDGDIDRQRAENTDVAEAVPNSSVFAAAEDFAEAIDADAEETRAKERALDVEEKGKKRKRTSSKSRQILQAANTDEHAPNVNDNEKDSFGVSKRPSKRRKGEIAAKEPGKVDNASVGRKPRTKKKA